MFVPRPASSANKRPPPPKSGYPAWAVGAVVVVGLGLIGAAVRVATLEPKKPELAPTAPAVEAPPTPPAKATPKPAKPEVAKPAKPVEPPKPVAEPEPEEPAPPQPPAPTHATSWARGATEKVTVQRVVDGDTFQTRDGRKVRLVGINTPEKSSSDPLHDQATALLRELVEGSEVTLEFDQEKVDQYKRTLAYVHKGDLFVNGEIVRRGLAYCYTWEPNTAHRDELIGWQREAREGKAGLWALPPPAPSELYVGDRRGHRFHRPGCKYIAKLSPERRVEYKTRDAAFDEGENPCQECKP